jgi:hypothetical protein
MKLDLVNHNQDEGTYTFKLTDDEGVSFSPDRSFNIGGHVQFFQDGRVIPAQVLGSARLHGTPAEPTSDPYSAKWSPGEWASVPAPGAEDRIAECRAIWETYDEEVLPGDEWAFKQGTDGSLDRHLALALVSSKASPTPLPPALLKYRRELVGDNYNPNDRIDEIVKIQKESGIDLDLGRISETTLALAQIIAARRLERPLDFADVQKAVGEVVASGACDDQISALHANADRAPDSHEKQMRAYADLITKTQAHLCNVTSWKTEAEAAAGCDCGSPKCKYPNSLDCWRPI